jgi:hypothetical protein
MIKKEQIKELVFNAIDELNQQMKSDEQMDKSEMLALFGPSATLDSLGFINLITTIEENIEDELDLMVTIIDEKAMSREDSPFLTVGTLIDYLLELVK